MQQSLEKALIPLKSKVVGGGGNRDGAAA